VLKKEVPADFKGKGNADFLVQWLNLSKNQR
jgi:hypothetical protein